MLMILVAMCQFGTRKKKCQLYIHFWKIVSIRSFKEKSYMSFFSFFNFFFCKFFGCLSSFCCDMWQCHCCDKCDKYHCTHFNL